MKIKQGDIDNASVRPWRIWYGGDKSAVIKAADETIVAIVHPDNAEIIVAAVNEFDNLIGRCAGAKCPKATLDNLVHGVS